MNTRSLVLLFVLLTKGWSQATSQIEAFTPVDAPRLLRGLGWNVTLDHEWEFAKVREAGGKEARFQFSWDAMESVDGVLCLSAKFHDALRWCAIYELEPMIVAAYGPPRKAVAELMVSADVPPDSASLPVSGDLAAIEVPYCHVLRADHTQLVAEKKWGYYGALITSVDSTTGSITLAATTTAAIPAGTRLTVNRLRYPSIASEDPNDPSTQAYLRYAHFLAEQIASYGLTGTVEIWNEPPWAHDPWDHRSGFYDAPPAELSKNSPNWGMLRALLADHLPEHVRYTWGGSHKSGTRGVLSLPPPEAMQAQVAATVASEGWHPYGPTPEYNAWNPRLLATSADPSAAALEGSNRTSNFKVGRRRAYEHAQRTGWTVPEQVSEAGLATANQLAKARWVTRFFLVHMAMGPAPQMERVNFYRLAEARDGYAMIDAASHEELPAFKALKGALEDAAKIGSAPVPYLEADLPTVQEYRGSFPLVTIPIVGRATATAQKNSFLFVCYQRTYAPHDAEWIALNPEAAPVKITLPAATQASRAWNLITREPEDITASGTQVTIRVAADPIAIEVAPLPATPGGN